MECYRNAIVELNTSATIINLEGEEAKIRRIYTGFFIDEKHIVSSSRSILSSLINARVPPSKNKLSVVGNDTTATVYSNEGVFRYKCKLVGIDRTSSIAVLEILDGRSCTFLKWGNSRKEKPLNKIYNISNELTYGITISSGTIRNNRFVFRDSVNSPELVTCDITSNFGSDGSPIINKKGEVVGVVVYTDLIEEVDLINRRDPNYYGYILSTSQYTAEYAVSLILSRKRTEVVQDELGSFLRIVKANIGLTTVFVDATTNISYNKLGGIIVLIDAGDIKKGDIVCSVNGVDVGFYDGMVSLATSLLKVTAGDEVAIRYRKKIDDYKIEYTKIIKTTDIEVDDDILLDSIILSRLYSLN